MAAKKDTTPKTAGPAADKKAALETALAQIEKQFGKGAVMKLGANVTMQVDAIPTGSLGLDLALGAACGWVNTSCRKDYGGNDRAVLLQKPEKSC